MTETRKITMMHAFALMITILGLVVTGVFVLFEMYSKISVLMIMAYSFGFFLFAFRFPKIVRKKVPIKLPKTNIEEVEKIKIGDEAEKIFVEIEKLEQEIKKQKAENKKVAKTVTKRTPTKKVAKQEKQKYASVKKGKTFHLSSCTMLLRQDSKNYVHYKTRAQALARGFRPCRVCNP